MSSYVAIVQADFQEMSPCSFPEKRAGRMGLLIIVDFHQLDRCLLELTVIAVQYEVK